MEKVTTAKLHISNSHFLQLSSACCIRRSYYMRWSKITCGMKTKIRSPFNYFTLCLTIDQWPPRSLRFTSEMTDGNQSFIQLLVNYFQHRIEISYASTDHRRKESSQADCIELFHVRDKCIRDRRYDRRFHEKRIALTKLLINYLTVRQTLAKN